MDLIFCLFVKFGANPLKNCLLYTSDAADEEDSVDLGGRRIEIHILVHNSVTNACSCSEFDIQAESRVLEVEVPDLASKLTFAKSYMRRPPFWNELNGNNSAIIELVVCSKFHTYTKMRHRNKF